MRVLVKTIMRPGGWDIEFLDPASGNPRLPRLKTERCPPPNERFPLPPAHPSSACNPMAHLLCMDATGANTAIAYDGINRLDVPLGDIDRFGGYLFQCLLGERWAEIEALTPAGGDIELEILIEPNDDDLQVLWWEMMFAGAEPLAAQKGRKVAITRLISTEKPPKQPADFQLPLKVLFVVGSQIDNALRPGAELIGLLNRVRLPVGGNIQTAHMHVRLVPDASWDDIQKAAQSFLPNVVHIVSHGELDPQGGGTTRLLLTAREPGDHVNGAPVREKASDPYPCSAARLLELVSVNGAPPPVMIINACHTAEVAGQGAADLAFTAQLVRGGVAMALGMSGEVADRACQIFTMSFYQGLLRGTPVTVAAAQGRRAALLDFPDDQHNVEWARPTLFMAQGINPALKILPPLRDWSDIAESYRTLKTPDVLCDRLDCMDRYESFRIALPPPLGKAAAFAYVTKDSAGGLGKTRLLEEIAARSVFDNFIPVIVRNNKENLEASHNHLETALRISAAVEKSREAFRLPPTPLTATKEFAYMLANIPLPDPARIASVAIRENELDAFLRNNRASGLPATVTMEQVLPLIQSECRALRDDLRVDGAPEPTVLLLLDDLHRYAGCVQAILPLFREYGLGRPGLLLPVVFTCYAAEEDKILEEALRQRQDVFMTPLNPFESGVVQRLACRQFVLSFWKFSVTSRRSMSEQVDQFFESVQEATNGRPVEYQRGEVKGVINAHKRFKTLIPTNFEEMLVKWN
jgi:CHAT domain